jgi:hypothetical protein
VEFKTLVVSAVFIGVFVIVPIILIMTEHQRKMAKILHGGDRVSDEVLSELRALRSEVGELRSQNRPTLPDHDRLTVR